MKISEVKYATLEEVKKMKSWDMNEMPRRAKWFLRPLAWLLAYPETLKYHVKIRKHKMDGIKPPYLLLCNHNSFFDFKVATRALFPHIANYIVAIDGFINREQLLRNVGCVLKRKFVPDAPLIKKIKHSLEHNHYICAVYPEARYSLTGTTAILPESLGKMVKLLKVPVVTLICHGHHLQQPVWNLKKRKVATSADFSLIFTKEDTQTFSVAELNEKIRQAFTYDDYQYQKEQQLRIKEPWRAEGIHKILYQCPRCKAEGKMSSSGSSLACKSCGAEYIMDEYGQLASNNGKTEFSHIPDWYEWERSQVAKQIKDGSYRIESDVHVDILQNETGYYRLGTAKFHHDLTGFNLSGMFNGTPFALNKGPLENYSVHIEYEYFGKGDGFSVSTLHDTYYLYSVDQSFSVTKLHFAVEELYKIKVLEGLHHVPETDAKTSAKN